MPAAAAIVPAVISGIQGMNANKTAEKQYELNNASATISAKGAIIDYEKNIADLEGSKIQYGIDIRDAQSQVDSYDKWLANYGAQYAQEVQSKQAQTDALMASGKESYENFLNAIGYADAMAGATGRVGAGTSQSHTTGMLDRKLVDYVGADRTLDANGGLFGSQLTAANMEMEQLKVDLDFQRQEMAANRELTQASIADWQKAISLTDQSIAGSKAAKNELEAFVAQNFGENGDRHWAQKVFDPLGITDGVLNGYKKFSKETTEGNFMSLAGNLVSTIFDPLNFFKFR